MSKKETILTALEELIQERELGKACAPEQTDIDWFDNEIAEAQSAKKWVEENVHE